MQHNSTDYLHLLIESLRLAFADSRWYVADPAFSNLPIDGMLSKDYASKRRQLINASKATIDCQRGSPVNSSDTVYFCVVDGKGNACSFINSNYMGFGTGWLDPTITLTLSIYLALAPGVAVANTIASLGRCCSRCRCPNTRNHP
jgi:gamma-glutamyltranspeptidase / glutathione hydrolase